MPRLLHLLSTRQPAILDRWLGQVLECYPPEIARMMKAGKDPFSNPLPHQLARGLKALLTVIVEEQGPEAALAALDEVLRVMAIQSFHPSRGLAFIFFLKQVVREELAPELEEADLTRELADLDATIDGLALLGFDVYMQRRQKLYDMRMEEMKQRISTFLRKTGLDLMNP